MEDRATVVVIVEKLVERIEALAVRSMSGKDQGELISANRVYAEGVKMIAGAVGLPEGSFVDVIERVVKLASDAAASDRLGNRAMATPGADDVGVPKYVVVDVDGGIVLRDESLGKSFLIDGTDPVGTLCEDLAEAHAFGEIARLIGTDDRKCVVLTVKDRLDVAKKVDELEATLAQIDKATLGANPAAAAVPVLTRVEALRGMMREMLVDLTVLRDAAFASRLFFRNPTRKNYKAHAIALLEKANEALSRPSFITELQQSALAPERKILHGDGRNATPPNGAAASS